MQSFIFTRPFDIQTKGDDLYLDGFISTTEKDLVNDVITVKCLESMKTQILERNIKLDLEHESFKGADNEEKEINKTKVPIGRLVDATIENNKLRVKAKINPHHSRYDETKGSIQGQYLDAFSIAYIPTRVSNEVKNGEEVRLLDDLVLLNVALTGNPVNTGAQIREIMIKSMEAVKMGIPHKRPKNPPEKEDEEDDDDEEKKKKKNKTKEKYKAMIVELLDEVMEDYKSNSENKELLEVKDKSNSHSEIKTKKEDIKMSDEQQTSEEASEEVEAVVESTESEESEAEAEAPEEAAPEAEESEDASDSLAEEVKALKEEVANLISMNKKVNSKALAHTVPKEVKDIVSVEPLDIIG